MSPGSAHTVTWAGQQLPGDQSCPLPSGRSDSKAGPGQTLAGLPVAMGCEEGSWAPKGQEQSVFNVLLLFRYSKATRLEAYSHWKDSLSYWPFPRGGGMLCFAGPQGSNRTRQEAEGEGAARARAFTVVSMGGNR